MTTKNTSGTKLSPEQTEFQLHKTQLQEFDNVKKKLIDFTERKLVRCINKTSDEQQRAALKKLLNDYISGTVVVAWRRGSPVFVHLTRDK